MVDQVELVSEMADAMHAAFDPWNADVTAMIDIAYMEGRFETMARAVVDWKLPCDVKLPPATTVRAGCTLGTLISALQLEGRPERFPDKNCRCFGCTDPLGLDPCVVPRTPTTPERSDG